MPNYLLVIIFAVLMLPGLIGVFIPVLPGVPYLFLIALVYGVIDRFHHLVGWEVLVLLLITLLSIAVDYLSGIIGARYGNASKKSILYGFVGFIAGTFLFPPLGGIIGLFVGVWLTEIIVFKDQKRALKAASGSLIGTLSGMVVNFILGLILLALFVLFAR